MYVHQSIRTHSPRKEHTMNRTIITRLSSAALALSLLTGCAATTAPPVTGQAIASPSNDAATAWDVWEYSNGAAKLKMDPARAFRVEYLGSATDYPQGLAGNEVALVGKDFRWYVFAAEYTR